MSKINSRKRRAIKCELIDHGVNLTCSYCGVKNLKPFRSRDDGSCEEMDVVSIDHIIPKSKGGKNERSNYTLSCKMCNFKKSSEIFNFTVLTVSDLLSMPKGEPNREFQNHPIYLKEKSKKELEQI